jgi:choice-of-anchor A domain-containing protein
MAWGAHRYSSLIFANRFRGFIDDARVYNRALTAPEVALLYGFNGTAASMIPTSTPPPVTACLAAPLGTANEFNLFTLNNVTAFSGSVFGRTVIGGSANISNYGFGQSLTDSNGQRDDLIVQTSLSFNGGQVYNGNIVYGTSASIAPDVVVPNGTVRQATIFNISQVTTELRSLSTRLSQLTTNGVNSTANGALTLTGTNSVRNVFSVSPTQLEQAWGIFINIPAGSTALVNVSGANVSFSNKSVYINNVSSDVTPGQQGVVFNFHQATSLTVSGISVKGSILAPLALLNFTNGQINGSVIANQLSTSSAEILNYRFTGCLPQ